ncbi:MAG: hypothetical protein ACRDOP_04430 [Gaiellaceae bacterium]
MHVRLFLVALLGVVVIGPFSGAAKAHTNYCGHSIKYWNYISPTSGAVTKYREGYYAAHGDGPHYHDYYTQYKPPGSSTWKIAHWHWSRQCPGHPV